MRLSRATRTLITRDALETVDKEWKLIRMIYSECLSFHSVKFYHDMVEEQLSAGMYLNVTSHAIRKI